MKTKSAIAALLTAPLFAIPLSALASSTWNLDTGCVLTSGSTCNPGATVAPGDFATIKNTTNTGDPTINATATAWSTGVNDVTAGTNFAAARLVDWGANGWGVMAGTYDSTNPTWSNATGESDSMGPHAADNVYGTDLISLSFGSQQVALNSVTIGWNGSDNGTGSYTDSDLSILRYTGSSAPASIVGKSVADLVSPSGGWQLVSHLSNVGTLSGNTASFNTGVGAVTSSWWLVSAYNSGYGGNTTGLGGSNDAYKLLAVAGTVTNPPPPPGVPEPAGIALVGIGLLSILKSRRRAPLDA